MCSYCEWEIGERIPKEELPVFAVKDYESRRKVRGWESGGLSLVLALFVPNAGADSISRTSTSSAVKLQVC